MHHFGEKTKINLDFGRFCITFVFNFCDLLLGYGIGVVEAAGLAGLPTDVFCILNHGTCSKKHKISVPICILHGNCVPLRVSSRTELIHLM